MPGCRLARLDHGEKTLDTRAAIMMRVDKKVQTSLLMYIKEQQQTNS